MPAGMRLACDVPAPCGLEVACALKQIPTGNQAAAQAGAQYCCNAQQVV